ncbi:DUF2238 domain-containing protein, partial [Vreelandella neptunia]|uniref:DUF2238 domain-containing protein n=1 Tax=Vreelandella neptunia TaxID=115551 RepID=UPI0025B2D1D3
RQRFRFTDLAYALIMVHGLILMAGGAWTYARVPFGFWIEDAFGLSRNPYDKIGHFAQGFVPAIIARELLVRVFRIGSGRLVAFLAVSICLAISAAYELVEWGAALALGQGADEFLGTQGDPWDTQSDMLMALIGALAATASVVGRIPERRRPEPVAEPPPDPACQWPVDADTPPTTLLRVVAALEDQDFLVRHTAA